MPGASLVAAVVAPDVLEAIPGDKEVFFGMLHLECGTTCTKADGIWLLQGQWSQVKDAVQLLEIIEKSKNMNKALLSRTYFQPDDQNITLEGESSRSRKSRNQGNFVVEWTDFFNELKNEFSQPVVDKFERIVTAAVQKEEEFKKIAQHVPVQRTKRSLRRRKGLPHRLKSTIIEDPLTSALANAFGESEQQNSTKTQTANQINDDVISVDSIDSVDIQNAVQEQADPAYNVRPQRRVKKSQKEQTSHVLTTSRTKRDGQQKVSRIQKRPAAKLLEIVSNLMPETLSRESKDVENDIVPDTVNDCLFVSSTSDMVFPSCFEEGILTPNQTSESKSIYRCPICTTFTATTKSSIKLHAFTKHLSAPHRCFVCKGVFSSKVALDRHRVFHRHETFPYLKCICSRIMTSRSGLTRHIASCHALLAGAKLLTDPNSDSLVDLSGVTLKKGSEKANSQTHKFACDICENFIANSSPRLVHHKLAEHAEIALKCSSCPSLSFKDFAEFYEHNSLHVTKLPCEICGKVFSNVRSHEMHQRTHESNFEKAAFVCAVCSRAFTTAYVLKYHMQRAHMEMGKRFSCSKCSRSFNQKIHLIEHLYTHDGLKPYSCDICKKGFAHHTTLQQHKLTHSALLRYKCKECPKSFRTRGSLLMHKSCHTERKHQCQYCGKLFTQKTARIRHERIHTGEQPFKCEICYKTFSDSSVLRRHKLTHDPSHSSRRSSKGAGQANDPLPLASGFGLFSTMTGSYPQPVVQPKFKRPAPKSRGRSRRTAANNNNSRDMATSLSSNLAAQPLSGFPGTSGAACFYQPQASVDSALDLQLFSPMSVLIQQPLNMTNDNVSASTVGLDNLAMPSLSIASETCPSPETPPPISMPDQREESSSICLFQQDSNHPSDLYQASGSGHEKATDPREQQPYHIIHVAPESMSLIHQLPSSSAVTTRLSHNNKFSAFYVHSSMDDGQRAQSRQLDSQQVIVCTTAQPETSSSVPTNLDQSQLYLATSPPPTTVRSDVDNPGPVSGLGSSNASGGYSQAFFVPSDSATTLFTIPADNFFSINAGQSTPSPPPQPSCSYQYGDMPLSLESPAVATVQDTDPPPPPQHQQSSSGALYQSDPSSFFSGIDGMSLTSMFSSQQQQQQQARKDCQGLNLSHHHHQNQTQQQSSVSASVMQPIVQMPAVNASRPQNAPQRAANNSNHYR